MTSHNPKPTLPVHVPVIGRPLRLPLPAGLDVAVGTRLIAESRQGECIVGHVEHDNEGLRLALGATFDGSPRRVLVRRPVASQVAS